jgi:myo-inositol 2-dehydrogenase/D-chiro-inositol 1-dehydrogenase
VARAVGIGVVGLGAAGSFHAETVAERLVFAELAAVVDASATRARSIGERLTVEWSTSYSDLLANSEVDGIVVATPTPLHPRMIEQAAKAKKHVFCEKPLGLDQAASLRAAEAAMREDVVLQVGFVRRFDPDWRRAAALVQSGTLGDIYLFRAGQRERIDYADTAYLPQVGNFFEDVMVHEFDVARWFVGDVEEISAIGVAPTKPGLLDAGDAQVATVTLRFLSGALGVIDGTMLSSYGYDCYTELLCERGLVRVGYGARRSDVTALVAGESTQEYPVDFRVRFKEAFTGELAHFVECIRLSHEPLVSVTDALAASALAEAATRSFVERRAIRLAPDPRSPLAGYVMAG